MKASQALRRQKQGHSKGKTGKKKRRKDRSALSGVKITMAQLAQRFLRKKFILKRETYYSERGTPGKRGAWALNGRDAST